AGESAAELIGRLPEGELARIIRDYGEERHARRLARAIVAARAESSIATTGRLAAIVRSVVRQGRDGIDPATRTFQALRIHVNDELGELDRGLVGAERLLRSGGCVAVVTFHSLEDRRVKTFLRRRSGLSPRQSRHLPERPAGAGDPAPSFRLLPANGTTPGAEEIRANPRARSARLRAAERTAHPAWPETTGMEARA
ncbi:MAG TPA: 16S rRNA (cytosine(1402)-N(4))-methyltransferase, partial [Methylomirabilota bacterium]|nr:16S rRNA (cytosine(1402)-N(4))-methyltransferase [Methylomirabilota bacterium]